MIPSDAAPLLWFTVAANAIALALCVWCGIDLFRVRSKMTAALVGSAASVVVAVALVKIAGVL